MKLLSRKNRGIIIGFIIPNALIITRRILTGFIKKPTLLIERIGSHINRRIKENSPRKERLLNGRFRFLGFRNSA